MTPRLITEADIPWMHVVAAKRYPAEKFDTFATEGWIRNTVLKSPLLFFPVRTDDAFLIAMLTTTPWTPAEFEVNILMVCADHGGMWQALALLRASINWARLRKCTSWKLTSENDDLTMLARRVGATELSPRFTLRL